MDQARPHPFVGVPFLPQVRTPAPVLPSHRESLLWQTTLIVRTMTPARRRMHQPNL